jgi:hypothetical protein
LEHRWTPSSGFPGYPANTLAVVPGDITAPGTVTEVTVPVGPLNLSSGRPSTMIGLFVRPDPGSALDPTIEAVRNASGELVPLRQGVVFNPRVNDFASAIAYVSRPGSLTVLVKGLHGSSGGFTLQETLPGDANGDGTVNLSDLVAMQKAYETTAGDANYNPAADANQNNFIGLGDAKMMLRNITPLTPEAPLQVKIALAPQDQAKGPNPKNSGGITNNQVVTILIHTTPGSIAFADSGLGDYSFTGGALATNANGDIAQKATLTSGINNFEYLIIDPYGQQVIRAYPIFWKTFAAPGSTPK